MRGMARLFVSLGFGKEAYLEPAKNVIHDGGCVAEFFAAGPSRRLETCSGKLFAQDLQRYSVLQADGDCRAEAFHESGHSRAFLCHAKEEFSRLSVGIHANRDVSLMSSDRIAVSDGGPLGRQAMPHSVGRPGQVCIAGRPGAEVACGMGFESG